MSVEPTMSVNRIVPERGVGVGLADRDAAASAPRKFMTVWPSTSMILLAVEPVRLAVHRFGRRLVRARRRSRRRTRESRSYQ